MHKANAIARDFAAQSAEILRAAIVTFSALALIVAGQALPFV